MQAELNEIDWTDMEEAARDNPTLALTIFMEEILPLLEKHVPAKKVFSKNPGIK